MRLENSIIISPGSFESNLCPESLCESVWAYTGVFTCVLLPDRVQNHSAQKRSLPALEQRVVRADYSSSVAPWHPEIRENIHKLLFFTWYLVLWDESSVLTSRRTSPSPPWLLPDSRCPPSVLRSRSSSWVHSATTPHTSPYGHDTPPTPSIDPEMTISQSYFTFFLTFPFIVFQDVCAIPLLQLYSSRLPPPPSCRLSVRTGFEFSRRAHRWRCRGSRWRWPPPALHLPPPGQLRSEDGGGEGGRGRWGGEVRQSHTAFQCLMENLQEIKICPLSAQSVRTILTVCSVRNCLFSAEIIWLSSCQSKVALPCWLQSDNITPGRLSETELSVFSVIYSN